MQQAVRAIRAACRDLLVITDVCLCEYTSHGHCGVVDGEEVRNDPTLDLLARMAVSHARAGADVVAPSDMMDGRVAAIRRALDAARLRRRRRSCPTPPSTRPASTARSARRPTRAPQFGDRRGYQMDPANAREALREVRLDVEEGADMVMVKPALRLPRRHPRRARGRATVPVAAYNVSGEYAMVKAAAQRGLDRRGARRDGDADLHRAAPARTSSSPTTRRTSSLDE